MLSWRPSLVCWTPSLVGLPAIQLAFRFTLSEGTWTLPVPFSIFSAKDVAILEENLVPVLPRACESNVFMESGNDSNLRQSMAKPSPNATTTMHFHEFLSHKKKPRNLQRNGRVECSNQNIAQQKQQTIPYCTLLMSVSDYSPSSFLFADWGAFDMPRLGRLKK